MLLHRRDGFRERRLGEGLGARAAARALLGGDPAAAELLLVLLLPGVLLVPLLGHRADGQLSGGTPPARAAPPDRPPGQAVLGPPASACRGRGAIQDGGGRAASPTRRGL